MFIPSLLHKHRSSVPPVPVVGANQIAETDGVGEKLGSNLRNTTQNSGSSRTLSRVRLSRRTCILEWPFAKDRHPDPGTKRTPPGQTGPP